MATVEVVAAVGVGVRLPATPEEWKIAADDLNKLWNFPHCIGALDDKHIDMQAPSNSGSFYFKYKHTHRIVLMALVDANYRVIYADLGAKGRISDGECSLHEQIENGNLNLPRASPLAGQKRNTPFVMVADDAFALSETLMQPYPATGSSGAHRVFNYRISRVRHEESSGSNNIPGYR
ncbi:Putative nuclease harbi1-like protein [Gryllus bimaculatus]|nr:Putative nuclease harbi1-like protein [Gryllus bimaculatus]